MQVLRIGTWIEFAVGDSNRASPTVPAYGETSGPVEIDIHEAHPVTEIGQCQGKIHRSTGFSHPSLTAHDDEFMLDPLQGRLR